MKLTKNMIQKIWNARDNVCGMDGWVRGKQYTYRAIKWDDASKKMLVGKYQFCQLIDTAMVQVKES